MSLSEGLPPGSDQSGGRNHGSRVLASQFVTGLRSDLKVRLAGLEGDMDHLLVRARFEEAKLRDLGNGGDKGLPEKTGTSNRFRPAKGGTQPKPRSVIASFVGGSAPNNACFSCGGSGHFACNFPYRGRGGPKEARGQVATNDKVVAVVGEGSPVQIFLPCGRIRLLTR